MPPVLPPPAPPDKGGGGLEGLSSQADRLLLTAEFNTSASQNKVCRVCRIDVSDCTCSSLQQPHSNLSANISRLYSQATKQDGKMSNLKLSSNLVDKLVSESPGRARLVLSLHQDSYVLGLLHSGSTYTEVVRLRYSDTYLLDCVDSESLPVIWIDLLQELNPDLFHNGSVICEIRECRNGGREAGVRRHVLLRPSTQSIICDSLQIGDQVVARAQESVRGEGIGGKEAPAPGVKLSSEEKTNIESQLILSMEPALCLDPNPVVGIIAQKTNQSRLKFSTPRLRRHVHKHYSHAAHSRKRKLESLPAPPEIKIYDFIQKLNKSEVQNSSSGQNQQPSAPKKRVPPIERLKDQQERSSSILRNSEDILRGVCPPPSCVTGSLHLADPNIRLALPSQVDVEKYARPLNRRSDVVDMSAQVLEEYILETAERQSHPERGQTTAARVYHTRLTILQRQATEEYIGELYVERDFKDEEKKGSTCRFDLGTKTDALKYINQFTEIFTEEGRKSVEITHKVPGQPPRVTFTPGLKAIMAQQAAQNAANAAVAQAAQNAAAAQSIANKKVDESSVEQSKVQSSESVRAGTQITLTSQVGSQPSGQQIILSKSCDGKLILSQSINSDFASQQQQLISPQQQQIVAGSGSGAGHILVSPNQSVVSQQSATQPTQRLHFQTVSSHQSGGSGQLQTIVVSQPSVKNSHQSSSLHHKPGEQLQLPGHILTTSGGQIVVSQSPQLLVTQQQGGGVGGAGQQQVLVTGQGQPGGGTAGGQQQVLIAQQQAGGQPGQVLVGQQQQGSQQVLVAAQPGNGQPSAGSHQVLITPQGQAGGHQVLVAGQQTPQQILVAPQQQQQQPTQVLLTSQHPQQAGQVLVTAQQQAILQQQQQQGGGSVLLAQQQSPRGGAHLRSPLPHQTKSPGGASDIIAASPVGMEMTAASPLQTQQQIAASPQQTPSPLQTIISSHNIIPTSTQLVFTQGQIGSSHLVTVTQSSRMAPPASPSPQHIILSAQSPGADNSAVKSANAAKVVRQLVQSASSQQVGASSPVVHQQQIRPRLVPTSMSAVSHQQIRHNLIRPQYSQVTLVPQQNSPQQIGSATSPGRAASTSQQSEQQQQQQATAPVNGTENQQEAISAIVQMFMSEEAQFKQKKNQQQHHGGGGAAVSQSSSDTLQLNQTDNNLAIVSSTMASNNSSCPSIELPTVPVPPSSLVGARLPAGNPSRVTLSNLNLKPQPNNLQQQSVGGDAIVSQPQLVKVTSQLAAQLARPVVQTCSSSLPSYSQAIASSHLSSALQNNNFKEPTSGGSTTLSLHELLSEERVAASVAVTSSNSGLLERLMAGSSTTSNGSSSPSPGAVSTNLNPLASQVPTVVATAQPSGINGSNDDITLSGLLSNPVKPGASSSVSITSPNKISPLLQQLQQPVQPVQPRQYVSSPSPKHHAPPSSPRTNISSPRGSARSPRPSLVQANSPRQVTASSLQQQLMQPPAPRYAAAQSVLQTATGRYTVPVTTQSILSAQLSQPPRSSSISLTRTNNNPQQTIVVTSPEIVQVSQSQGASSSGGFIQVSQGQILQLAGGQQAAVVSAGAAGIQHAVSGGPSIQHQDSPQQQLQLQNLQTQGGLQLQGLSNIQVQLPQQQTQQPQQQQQQQQSSTLQVQPNHSNLVSMNLVPSASNQINGQSGILTLGQVQVVNQSIPVQLSIPGHSQPYTISVSLPDGDQSLSNGALSELKSQGNTFSRLLNGPTVSGGGGGVVLQSSSGNIFQIGSAQDSSQQQQPQPQYSLKAGLKPTQQVMVRPANPNQTNPVLVQMPGGNINQPPIRIVRSLPVNHQQLPNNSGTTLIASSGLSAGVKTVSGAVASPQGGGGPPTPGVPSPASVTSPGGQVGGPGTPGSIPESPLFVQLHQNHGSSNVAGVAGAGDHHHYLQLNQKQVNLVNQQGGGVPSSPGPPPQLINNQSMLNQTHLKIRPQRKQSLK